MDEVATKETNNKGNESAGNHRVLSTDNHVIALFHSGVGIIVSINSRTEITFQNISKLYTI